MPRTDLYGSEKRWTKALSKLEDGYYDEEIGKENRQDLLRFFPQLTAEGVSPVRKCKYLQHLRRIAGILDKKRLIELDKDEIIHFCSIIESMTNSRDRPFSEATKIDLRNLLRNFIAHLRDESDPLVLWLYSKRNKFFRQKAKIHLEKKRRFLTRDEVMSMISSSGDARDSAMIGVCFEGCLRPSELLNINFEDIMPYENGFRLQISGKTGSRTVFCIENARNLGRWMDCHPTGKGPVWIANHGKRIGIAGLNKALRRCAGLAGIRDSDTIKAYDLRHAGITSLRARGVSDAGIVAIAGWRAGTRRLRTYDHTSSKDFEKELGGVYARTEAERKQYLKEEKTRQECPRCKNINDVASKYCSVCATPLDPNTLIQTDPNKEIEHLKAKLETIEKFFDPLIDSPKFQAVVRELTSK